MKGFWTGLAAVVAAVAGNAEAASYDDIPPIEAYGQHFFYSNNGSQLYVHSASAQPPRRKANTLPQGRGIPAKLLPQRHRRRQCLVY